MSLLMCIFRQVCRTLVQAHSTTAITPTSSMVPRKTQNSLMTYTWHVGINQIRSDIETTNGIFAIENSYSGNIVNLLADWKKRYDFLMYFVMDQKSQQYEFF